MVFPAALYRNSSGGVKAPAVIFNFSVSGVSAKVEEQGYISGPGVF